MNIVHRYWTKPIKAKNTFVVVEFEMNFLMAGLIYLGIPYIDIEPIQQKQTIVVDEFEIIFPMAGLISLSLSAFPINFVWPFFYSIFITYFLV